MNNTRELGAGWLYVITHANARGLVKVGITDRPTARMDELKDPEVLARVPVRHPRRHEQRLHQKYASHRLPQSEWFSLEAEQLDELLEHVAELAQHFLELVVLPSKAKPEFKPEPEPEPEPEPVRIQEKSADVDPVKWAMYPKDITPDGWAISEGYRPGWTWCPKNRYYYLPGKTPADAMYLMERGLA